MYEAIWLVEMWGAFWLAECKEQSDWCRWWPWPLSKILFVNVEVRSQWTFCYLCVTVIVLDSLIASVFFCRWFFSLCLSIMVQTSSRWWSRLSLKFVVGGANIFSNMGTWNKTITWSHGLVQKTSFSSCETSHFANGQVQLAPTCPLENISVVWSERRIFYEAIIALYVNAEQWKQ